MFLSRRTQEHKTMILRRFRLSGKPWSTIGFEKEHNEAFRVKDEAEFIRFMLAEIPPAPPESAALRAANSGVIVAAA
jgi:hydroxyacylglutathione hydrolase